MHSSVAAFTVYLRKGELRYSVRLARLSMVRVRTKFCTDYLYVGPNGQHRLILIIRGDFKGMISLEPCENPDSDLTSQALLKWRSTFGKEK
jgi:hypothetical protein